MGSVNFVTDVNKNVDINKDVDLDVDKEVQARTEISGNLATAEASADAIGGEDGDGDGVLVPVPFDFLLDDGSDRQTTITVDDGSGGPTENTGQAPGDVGDIGGVDGPFFDPDFPDGATFDGTSLSDGLREFFIDQLPIGAGGGDAEASLITTAGDRLAFNNDDETASNNSILYTNGGTPFSIVGENANLADPTNALVIEDVIFNPGEGALGGPATIRVEIEFTSGGQSESGAVYFTDTGGDGGFTDGQNIVIPLGLFTGQIAAAPINSPLPGTTGVFTVDDDFNAALDFSQLDSIELRILDDTAGSFEDPGQVPGENMSTGGTDISVEEIRFEGEGFDEQEGGGNLAETDVFAQVTEDGAFSFSEALAAIDFA